MQIKKKIKSLNPLSDNSENDFIANIWNILNLDDINLILNNIKKNKDLIISIKNLFFERL